YHRAVRPCADVHPVSERCAGANSTTVSGGRGDVVASYRGRHVHLHRHGDAGQRSDLGAQHAGLRAMRAQLMNDARKTRGRCCAGSASVPLARLRPGTGTMPARPAGPGPGTGTMPALPAGPGQALVEFAIVATILL